MSRGGNGGREVVINGVSVLGFCKAVQGLTGFSMRMAHAWGQEWLTILPQIPLREIISLPRALLEKKCVQTRLKMSAIEHEFSKHFQRFEGGNFKRFQKAPCVITAHNYLILCYSSTNRVISHATKPLCSKLYCKLSHVGACLISMKGEWCSTKHSAGLTSHLAFVQSMFL